MPKEIQFFLKVKTTDLKELQNKFAIWFASRLLGAPLHEYVCPNTQSEEYDKFLNSAQALADKIDWMTSFENTHSDMDSVFRMLCRICDVGTKKIPDCDKVIEENARYWKRSGKTESYRNAVAGLGKSIGHFRWNHNKVYTLHPTQIQELIRIIQEWNYFDLKPDVTMFTHESKPSSLEIARKFSILLYEELGDIFFPMAKRSHLQKTYCESHDFCDANMIMLDAFYKITGKTEINNTMKKIWNEAWKIAKSNNFFISEMEQYKIWKGYQNGY